jgi:beta-N-acetylglucosaminidase
MQILLDKKCRRIGAFVLFFSLLISAAGVPQRAAAETVIAKGTINGMNVYVRNEPGLNGTYKLVALDKGHQVDIIGQTTVDGKTWYHLNCTVGDTSYTGWTYGLYVTITSTDVTTTPTDGDFAAELRTKGFPESYISALCALHEKYPSWEFEAVITGIDWNTAVTKESANGKNLVENTVDDAWKSTETGAYDWNTNTWTIYDSGRWVAAHPGYIAYCMDPRNFLDENSIFMFENLSYSSSQNLAGVQAVLKDSFMAGDFTDVDGTKYNYAQTFLTIGQDVGASPYYLASRVRLEQGTGTSSMISGTYSGFEGYFNYFNYGAYGSTSEAALQSGLTTAKKQGWNSRYKSLSGGAKLIAANYINAGQNTIYFQKFNVVNKANLYSHQYMANVTAAITEGRKMAAGYADKNQSFVFRIPVYNNMPDAAVTYTATGNPNNYLSSLQISGLSLTPSFTAGTTEYSMVVGNSISSIAVTASPVSSKSTVTGTGNYNLVVGSNTIKVNCKSQSGSTRTYTVTVVRQEAAGGSVAAGTVTSSTYTIGSAVTGITPGTSAADFIKGITVSGGSARLLTASGAENTGTVGTGNQLAVYDANGGLTGTYEIVIYGDLNGDGAVNALDMILMNRHIIGSSSLSGPYLAAADANRKGDGVNALDMIMMNRHILGMTTIQQ